MQNQDPSQPPEPGGTAGHGRRREKTPIKDEFTEFSQYGSRFMLNQMTESEKKKEKNLVEHIQENKLFKKVASTCQNYYRKSSSAAATPTDPSAETIDQSEARTKSMDQSEHRVQILPSSSHANLKDLESGLVSHMAPPAALPRAKKLPTSGGLKLSRSVSGGEPDKLDHHQLERKTVQLFKKVEQSEPSQAVSMHTDPRGSWMSR